MQFPIFTPRRGLGGETGFFRTPGEFGVGKDPGKVFLGFDRGNADCLNTDLKITRLTISRVNRLLAALLGDETYTNYERFEINLSSTFAGGPNNLSESAGIYGRRAHSPRPSAFSKRRHPLQSDLRFTWSRDLERDRGFFFESSPDYPNVKSYDKKRRNPAQLGRTGFLPAAKR